MFFVDYRSALNAIIPDILFNKLLQLQMSKRVINTAQKIIGCPLPNLEHLSTSYCLRKTKAITGDPSHPAYPRLIYFPLGDATGPQGPAPAG